MEKVKGDSIFYTHDNKVIYYKEKGENLEEDVIVVSGSEIMNCHNKTNGSYWKVKIKFEHGRAVLFSIRDLHYTRDAFFDSFNLVTESYYNENTGTKAKSINNEIGNYRFWKNMQTKEVLILNDKFIVQCGFYKGKDVGKEFGYMMINIPTKICCNTTGEIVSKEVTVTIRHGKLTIIWPSGSNNILYNDLDLFREHYLFIDDEDFVEEGPKVIPKNPLTEKECFKPEVEKGKELGIGNYSFWSDGSEVIVAKDYKSIHGTIYGLDVRDSFTFKRMPVPTTISPPYNVNVRVQTFDLKLVEGVLYIRVNDVIYGRESTVKAFLSEGGKFIYKELETTTFNGLGSYKQISSYPSLNNKAGSKPRDYIDAFRKGVYQDWILERQREKRKEIDNLHSIWAQNPWPVLPEWITKPMIQVGIDGKIRTDDGIKNETKTNVELKLIELEDEEDLMNEQVFKMKVIN